MISWRQERLLTLLSSGRILTDRADWVAGHHQAKQWLIRRGLAKSKRWVESDGIRCEVLHTVEITAKGTAELEAYSRKFPPNHIPEKT